MIKCNKQVEDTLNYVHKIFRREELEYINKEQGLTEIQKKEMIEILDWLKEKNNYR